MLIEPLAAGCEHLGEEFLVLALVLMAGVRCVRRVLVVMCLFSNHKGRSGHNEILELRPSLRLQCLAHFYMDVILHLLFCANPIRRYVGLVDLLSLQIQIR